MGTKQSDFWSLLKLAWDDSPQFTELVKRNGDILFMTGPHEETLFHYLIVEEQLEAAKRLRALGATLESRNEFGATPLIDAASIGALATVQFLVSEGANINAVDENRESALFLAASGKHREVFEFLVSCGADPNLEDELGDTPAKVLERG